MHSESGVDDFVRGKRPGALKLSVSAFLIFVSLFQLYTSIFGPMESFRHRSFALTIYLMAMFGSIILNKQGVLKIKDYLIPIFLVITTLLIGIYTWLINDDLAAKLTSNDSFTTLDMLVGLALILLVLEATRRFAGWILVILAAVFAAYGLFGQYFPGLLAHRGIVFKDMISEIFIGQSGIFGQTMAIMSTYLFLFILFGAFLESVGTGKLFMSLASAMTRGITGGLAMSSVVSSSLFGTISGSAVSNVLVTGTFTIPAMIKSGYKREFAAAVESVASTGGQIMPPVMGIAAFVMADLMGMDYSKIMVAAIIPAALFYVGLSASIYFTAKRQRIQDIYQEDADAPTAIQLLKKQGYRLIPLLVLLILIIAGFSLMRTALWAIIACIVVGLINQEDRMTWRKFLKTLESGAKAAVSMAAILAWAGMIIALLFTTGLGVKVGAFLMLASDSGILVLLIVAAIGAIILGMGMTTVAVYIILAISVVPTLVRLGINPMAAHLFAFYFGVLSYITPPVCIATYAAANLAKANYTRAGFEGLRLAISGFIIPFVFVFEPLVILQGDWTLTGAINVLSLILGIITLSSALSGYLIRKNSLPESIVLGVCSILLVLPDSFLSMSGFVITMIILIRQIFQARDSALKGVSLKQ